MKRLGQFLSAIAVVGLVAGAASAQVRKLIAPIRGEATLDMTKPATKLSGKEVVTVIVVRNPAEKGAIAGLKVEENWYDKAGNPVAGDSYRHAKPLRAGEVVTITLRTPRSPNMNSNKYQFTHANGTIKANVVPKIEVPPTSSPEK
ncbi:MAG TPA: hypothetical protein VMW48_20255 [Vicinamibacterales bacterium]|nr:hypothetical protein [Vicinamibacterales bacterium]